MPRFAILTHDHPFPHWDFLIELDLPRHKPGTKERNCPTWRLLAEPGLGKTLQAEQIPDHRAHYLTYEGPVSGGRGTVQRWDAGTYEWVDRQEDSNLIALFGERIQGLCQMNRAAGEDCREQSGSAADPEVEEVRCRWVIQFRDGV